MDIFGSLVILCGLIVIGAVFGFAFGFVPLATIRLLMTFVVGVGAFWFFASTFNEAQGILIGGPVLLIGFGFVAALWLTVGIRSHRRNRAVQKKALA